MLRRRSAQFLNPSQLGFVLRPLPDERSDTALIVCRERNEAEGLQPIADGGSISAPPSTEPASVRNINLTRDPWSTDLESESRPPVTEIT